MNKLLECSIGPWDGPHISDDSTTCNCKGIVNGVHAGGIASVHVDNGIPSIGHGGNACPPLEEAKANGLLLTAAWDHALIWWAGDHGWTFDKNGDGTWFVDCFLGDQPYCAFDDMPSDPFGFPILTDDLRTRLIAEMEGAK